MLRLVLLVVAGLAGLALTGVGGVLAAMMLGSVSGSDRAVGAGLVAGLVVWVGLHLLGWRLSGGEAHATAGLVLLGVAAALDVVGVVALVAALGAAARP